MAMVGGWFAKREKDGKGEGSMVGSCGCWNERDKGSRLRWVGEREMRNWEVEDNRL